MSKHLSLSVQGEIVGDVVAGDHDLSFYSVRPALKLFDGRSFKSLAELRALVERALSPLRAA